MASRNDTSNRIERLQVETTVGQYFFQDLYNKEVYFEDFDDKSSNYLRLDYDASFNFSGGRNFIGIRGTAATMLLNSEILVEVIDANGQLMKSQVYGLGDELDTKVISIDVAPNTPPGDTIVSIIGVASQSPDGSAIPGVWQGVPNFRWTRIFTTKPGTANTSPVLYSETSRPVIKIEEILKPFYTLTHNQDLESSGLYWTGNPTSSYILSSDGYASDLPSPNTNTKVSYRKSGDKYFLTAQPQGTSFIDFGGFTKDMEGGIVIVRDPQIPRPASFLGYTSEHDPSTNPVFAAEEEGDGLFEDISYLHPTSTVPTKSFVTGAYVTMVEEVISPFEIRTTSPHTTTQGTTAANYQDFEHFEFSDSDFELMWSQAPVSYSMMTSSANGGPLNTSYAHVTFNNLEPLTGDVTRIKCYMKNEQAPFDWMLASDNAVWAQELLYRKDFEKYRAPIGDFTSKGVAHNGATSLKTYWTSSGVGTNNPSLGIYQQQTAAENPPVEDCMVIGDNGQALNLDDTSYWVVEPSGSNTASFYEGQWYELSFKAVSQKTQIPSWTAAFDNAIEEPKISVYMSGSAFTDGGQDGDLGKFIGLIEDVAVKKKQVDYDYKNNEKEIGKKFIFRADGTEGGKPKFKIDSGVWYLWDISIKPWDRNGFTPGTWDVIFPTIKCNVARYDSLDFKFEFYNDYGDIANYTAVVPHVPWKNELTATFTNIVTNTVTATGPATFSGGISASGPNYFSTNSFSGPTTFSSTVNFNGPTTFSGGMSSSGPNLFGGNTTISGPVSFSGPITAGGPVTMSGPGLFGQDCNDSWIISGSVYLPCLPEASQTKIVNWDPITGQLKVTSSAGLGGDPDQNLFETIRVSGQTDVVADTTTDVLTFVEGANVTISTAPASDEVTFAVNGFCKTSYGTFGVDGGTTQTAASCNEAMKLHGYGGITTSFGGPGEIHISMSSAYLTNIITNTAGNQDVFKTIAVTHSSLPGPAISSVVADSPTDTLTLVGGTNVTLSSNASTDAITMSVSMSGAGGADNLGNHTATTDLQMGNNWITSSARYGHAWPSTPNVNYAEIQRTATDVLMLKNVGSYTNKFEIADDVDGFSFKPGNLTFAQTLLPTHGGMQIKGNNDWHFYSLKEADTFHNVKYNTDTGELSYIRENTFGSNGACLTTGRMDKATVGITGFNPFFGAASGNELEGWTYINCTTTIGPPLYIPDSLTGLSKGWTSFAGTNDETAWLMVNGFNSMDCPPGEAVFQNSSFNAETGMHYAAIFNKMPDPQLLGSDEFDCMEAGAGHGVKIGVSSAPRTIPLKGGGANSANNEHEPFLNCTIAGTPGYYNWVNPANGLIQSKPGPPCGQGNVFYLSLFHKGWELNNLTGANTLVDHYAGGIRKDHYNYKNAIKIDFVSDRRLKQDITDTVLNIDHLMGIPVRDFEWKATPQSEGGMRVSGFIAQEVAEVFPDAVTGDEEQNPDPISNPMVMDYNAMIPLLVKSVQDQQKMIDELKERISILEKR